MKALEHPIFKIVSDAADEIGQEVYVVGGFVRDQFLHRPSKDIDFVTLGNGIDLATRVGEMLGRKVDVFKNFGTAHIKNDDWDFEFVGARKESYRKDSRKPIVENGTLEDDQLRRDFTINAMAIDLNSGSYGQLLDPFNGVQDLNDGILRTPLEPGKTYSDDPLRMMRAIRFATQLNFKISEDSWLGIRENASRLKIVSQERITEELNKIILADKPSIGFKMMFDTRILHQFFPEMVALQGVEVKNGISHKDNFYHTLKVLDNVAERSDDLWLRWAAILHDIAKPPTKSFNNREGWTFHGHEYLGSKMVKPIFRRFKLPLNEHMKFVQKMVLLHLRPIVLSQEIVTDSAVRRLLFDAGDDIEQLIILCRSDITSKNEKRVARFLRNLDVVEQKIKDVEERDRVRNFQPAVSGEEIMQIFDMRPGKMIGTIKNALKDAVLDGVIPNNREDALKFVKQKGTELGLKVCHDLDQ